MQVKANIKAGAYMANNSCRQLSLQANRHASQCVGGDQTACDRLEEAQQQWADLGCTFCSIV